MAKTRDIKKAIKKPMTIKTTPRPKSKSKDKTQEALRESKGSAKHILISNDNKKGGVSTFQLSRYELSSILNLIKPLSRMEETIIFYVDKKVVRVGQNQEGVIALLELKPKIEKSTKKPFVFAIPKEVLSNISNVASDYITVKIDGSDLTIYIGDTKLEMATVEDLAIPHIEIDLDSFKSKSEVVIPDILESALYRLKVVSKGSIGALETNATLGKVIEVGSNIYFTEIKLGLKKINVGISPQFFDHLQVVAKTAKVKVEIFANKDYILATNDQGFMYMTTLKEDGFTVSFDSVVKGRTCLSKITVDKRSIVTALKKLAVVTTGVKDPIVFMKLSKNLNLSVQSLNGKKSSDTIAIGDKEGGLKSVVKVRQDLLDNTLSILNNHVEIDYYEDFIVIADDEQRVLFSLVE
jgi:hypothetical protein